MICKHYLRLPIFLRLNICVFIVHDILRLEHPFGVQLTNNIETY